MESTRLRVNISIAFEVGFDGKGQGTEYSSIGLEIELIKGSGSIGGFVHVWLGFL